MPQGAWAAIGQAAGTWISWIVVDSVGQSRSVGDSGDEKIVVFMFSLFFSWFSIVFHVFSWLVMVFHCF